MNNSYDTSRIFKFRVWSNSHQTWITRQLQFDDQFLNNTRALFVNDDCVIQQFIGLKDKKGKDIYEGDFLKADYSTFTKHGVFSTEFEVIFEYGKFRLKHIKSAETFVDFSKNDMINTIQSKELEIIGNIFENKDSIEN
jgi:uncharacterized phage protein (TIGR01671 family)